MFYVNGFFFLLSRVEFLGVQRAYFELSGMEGFRFVFGDSLSIYCDLFLCLDFGDG